MRRLHNMHGEAKADIVIKEEAGRKTKKTFWSVSQRDKPVG